MILLDLPHYYMKNQMKINFDFNLPTLMYVGMNIASKIVEYVNYSFCPIYLGNIFSSISLKMLNKKNFSVYNIVYSRRRLMT